MSLKSNKTAVSKQNEGAVEHRRPRLRRRRRRRRRICRTLKGKGFLIPLFPSPRGAAGYFIHCEQFITMTSFHASVV